MTSRRLPALALAALLGLISLIVAAGSSALVEQSGNLRVTVNAAISPSSLPRHGRMPISVSVDGRVSTTDLTPPPQLRLLRIEINREGRFDVRGLPVCHYSEIQPSNNARALSACRSALVGKGTFAADISLDSQKPPYSSQGRLLLFNGRSGGKAILLGHIYMTKPFTSSFVIPFHMTTASKGTYGTILTADIAKALGNRRNLTGIEVTLFRRYRSGGKRRSYISSGCPAPKGISVVPFPMVRTTFAFGGHKTIRSTLIGTCRATH